MKSFHIEDKKTFTQKLFLKEEYDEWWMTETEITTFNTYTIDGRINKKFYSGEEYIGLGEPEFSRWKDVRKLCFEMIKGNKTPTKFKIVLKAPENLTEKMVNEAEGSLKINDIQGLFINIRFENESMDIITATSLNIFSMDKSVEESFDKYIERNI